MKGTLAAGGGLALSSVALAGCSPSAAPAPEAPSDVPAKALFEGYNSLYTSDSVATGKDPIAPLEPPSSWDRSADIVVVGLGGGGLAASLRAAEEGASVIGIEKTNAWGGSSKWATTFAVPGGARCQNEAGVPFDYEGLVTAMASAAGMKADIPLIRRLLKEGPAFIDWMEDRGAEWEVEPVLGSGLCWRGATEDGFIAGAAMPVCDFTAEKAAAAGAEFLYGAEAIGLVKEGDRVVGVKISDSSGESFIQATQGVILTTGGMLNNRDMLAAYAPTVANRCKASMASTSDTGEGIRMGLGAGAQISGWDSYCAFDGGMNWAGWSHFLYGGDVQLVRQPWLGISSEGKRYPYYDDHAPRRYPQFPGLDPVRKSSALFNQAEILQTQPGACGHLFFDADYEKNAPVFGQTYCRKLITPDMANIDRMPEFVGPHDWKTGAKSAIEEGTIAQADTLEELAEKLSYDADILIKAVEDWNSICAAGVDDELEFPAEWLIPVKTPPFYGAAIGSYAISSNVGLRVDPDMAVVGTDGNVVPGLFAGGMTTGGANGESTFGTCYSPLGTVALAFTMGYIAAGSALAL
jgi:hypothetical protein